MSFTRLLKRITTGSFDEKKSRPVGITATMKSLVVAHKGTLVEIKRNEDNNAVIPALFNRVSRPCPPFCVQPMKVAEGVETIGELELLDYLKKTKDNSVVVVDSRLKSWESKGTIPGSIHIPWTSLVLDEGATPEVILSIMANNFSVTLLNNQVIEEVAKKERFYKSLDFSHAKTIVLFCNGSWCGQTSESIKSLLDFGYPAEKIKYYRDGMQGWVSLGLTTVSDKDLFRVVDS